MPICCKCKQRERDDATFCRVCRAEYMKEWRLKNKKYDNSKEDIKGESEKIWNSIHSEEETKEIVRRILRGYT